VVPRELAAVGVGLQHAGLAGAARCPRGRRRHLTQTRVAAAFDTDALGTFAAAAAATVVTAALVVAVWHAARKAGAHLGVLAATVRCAGEAVLTEAGLAVAVAAVGAAVRSTAGM
jgi:hypothetical protein